MDTVIRTQGQEMFIVFSPELHYFFNSDLQHKGVSGQVKLLHIKNLTNMLSTKRVDYGLSYIYKISSIQK
jgi:hypothetical protein